MVVISSVVERRKVVVKCDNKGDSGYGGIVVEFLIQGRGSGNRTSSIYERNFLR